MTQTQDEVFEGLDIGLPCDFVDCETTPIWAVLVSCCGSAYIFCELHYQDLIDYVASGRPMICDRCKQVFKNPSGLISHIERL